MFYHFHFQLSVIGKNRSGDLTCIEEEAWSVLVFSSFVNVLVY